VINYRLRVFDDLTLPLLDYYDNREILVTVDGSQPVDAVTAAAVARLDTVRPQLG
jgi:adenylate kinase